MLKNENGTEIYKTVPVILGNEFYIDSVALMDHYLSGKNDYAQNAWVTAVGGNQTFAQTVTATTAGMTEAFASYECVLEGAAFYGVVENGYDIYGASGNDFKNAIKTVKNDTVTVTVLSDMIGVGTAYIGAGATVYFDLCGNTVDIAQNTDNKSNVFEITDKNALYIYSSVEGGKIFGFKAIVNIKGGNDITLSFGSFDGNDYGKNLYAAASCLADNGTNTHNVTLNVNGGTYARSVADYSGFIVDRTGGMTVTINDAVFVNNANANGFFNFAATVADDATFVPSLTVTNTLFDATSTLNLPNTDNRCVASYENCQFIRVKANVLSKGTYSFKNCVSANVQMDDTDGNPVKMWDEARKVTLYFNSTTDHNVTAHEIDYVVIYKTVDKNYVNPTLSGNLVNLTLQSDFVVNVYVPVDTPAVKVALKHGDVAVDLAKQATVEIEGKSYYHFTYALNANAATDYVRLYLVDESGFVKLMKISIADYAKKILDGSFDLEEKQLMMALLRYASEADVLLDGAEDATLTGILTNAKYEAYVTDYTDYGTALDVSALAEAVSSARLNLDSQPDFVFTLVKEFAGTVTITYRNFGGVDVTKTYVVEAGEEASNVSLNTMKIHELWKNITVTVEGTVGETAVNLTGTYNLGTYVQGVAESEEGYALAKAIFAYSKMAAAYREFVVANGGL